ncbi:unnamed protein product [Amoebophrya sp. A25]|nr:unnamed protein product [Amoebophrya sp. A25]|eukprot:GSA25T00012357001.1
MGGVVSIEEVITLPGLLYATFGCLPCVILFVAKDELCSAVTTETTSTTSYYGQVVQVTQTPRSKNAVVDGNVNEDCPHPSVSDVEHQSDMRGAIVAVFILRVLACTALLLLQRAVAIKRTDGLRREQYERDKHRSELWRARQLHARLSAQGRLGSLPGIEAAANNNKVGIKGLSGGSGGSSPQVVGGGGTAPLAIEDKGAAAVFEGEHQAICVGAAAGQCETEKENNAEVFAEGKHQAASPSGDKRAVAPTSIGGTTAHAAAGTQLLSKNIPKNLSRTKISFKPGAGLKINTSSTSSPKSPKTTGAASIPSLGQGSPTNVKPQFRTNRSGQQFFATEDDWELHKTDEATKSSQFERGEQYDCDWVFLCSLLVWVCFDLTQLFVDNKENSGLHNTSAIFASLGIGMAHLMHIAHAFMDKATGESKQCCACCSCCVLFGLVCCGIFLLANLGNVAANTSWSDAQWAALSLQAGTFLCVGLTFYSPDPRADEKYNERR